MEHSIENWVRGFREGSIAKEQHTGHGHSGLLALPCIDYVILSILDILSKFMIEPNPIIF